MNNANINSLNNHDNMNNLNNNNIVNNDNSQKTLVMNQPALNETEGATALDLNTAIEENKAKEAKDAGADLIG